MISDTLTTALVEIGDYLEMHPEAYEDQLPAINCLREHMDIVRAVFDTPPGTKESIRANEVSARIIHIWMST